MVLLSSSQLSHSAQETEQDSPPASPIRFAIKITREGLKCPDAISRVLPLVSGQSSQSFSPSPPSTARPPLNFDQFGIFLIK